MPCGGGGLLSGSAITARGLAPQCRVIGVEPAAGDDATRSFHTGPSTPYIIPIPLPMARAPLRSAHTPFHWYAQYVDDMMTVSDDDLVRTMQFVWTRLKLVVEPTGVLGLAAVFNHRLPVEGKRIGAILSGGNVDIVAAGDWFKSIGPE